MPFRSNFGIIVFSFFPNGSSTFEWKETFFNRMVSALRDNHDCYCFTKKVPEQNWNKTRKLVFALFLLFKVTIKKNLFFWA